MRGHDLTNKKSMKKTKTLRFQSTGGGHPSWLGHPSETQARMALDFFYQLLRYVMAEGERKVRMSIDTGMVVVIFISLMYMVLVFGLLFYVKNDWCDLLFKNFTVGLNCRWTFWHFDSFQENLECRPRHYSKVHLQFYIFTILYICKHSLRKGRVEKFSIANCFFLPHTGDQWLATWDR